MKGFKISFLLIAILSAFTIILTGCGGGGGEVPSGAIITVGGVASKGPINGGTVKVYALNANGSKGNQIGTTTTTKADGSYSVNIGSYSGNILVEVTDGTYTNEATGALQTNTKLSAALSGVSENVSVAVTPLTEIAYQLVGPNLTIDQANSFVGIMVGFSITDKNIMPVDVTDSTASSKATPDQIKYGLMLATISQMITDGTATDVSNAITQIKNDLSDNKLDTVGGNLSNALTKFIINPNNQSGVTTSDTLATNLTEAINYITNNTILPPSDTTNLNKAKALVADLRNTVISIYNYHREGVGVPGVMETPFKNLSEELKTKIEPELTATVDRIGWIIKSAGEMLSGALPGQTKSFTRDSYILTIAISPYLSSATFTVTENGIQIDSGTLTLTVTTDGLITISGAFNATMKTVSGNLTANLNYSATVSGSSFKSMTFTGYMTAPGPLVVDFSQSGQKLDVTLAPIPGKTIEGIIKDIEEIYPTSIYLKGGITTTTSQMDGILNISSIVWNSVDNLESDYYQALPKKSTFEGSFNELQNDLPTGVKFTGKITGSWDNAETYNIRTGESPANFPKWNASFDGRIEAPSRPTITTFLKVTQSEYKKYTLDVNYRRTNTNGTVVFLSGSGSFNSATKILAATLSNQDGMSVSISFDDTKSKDAKFTGAIAASGGTKMADLYTQIGMPMVKYIDNYIESIF